MISPFFLYQPDSLEEASSLLAQCGEDAKILAGGSELILLFKMSLSHAKYVIDIKRISQLGHLVFDDRNRVLRIGALVTHRTLENSEIVQKHFPLLAELERKVGNVRIRNVGTLAGNLCFADPHSDPSALLLAYESKVRVLSVRGERTVEISDFFVDYYETALGKDEILIEIEVPKLPENSSGIFLRFCPGERPIVTVAVLMRWEDGACDNGRLVLGCVGPKPIRAREVEESLKGKSVNEILARAEDAGGRAAALCDPLGDVWGSIEYKRQIVKTLVSRGITQLCQERA